MICTFSTEYPSKNSILSITVRQSLKAFAKAPLEELKFEYATQLTDISALAEKSIHTLALPSVQKDSFPLLKKLPLTKNYINGLVLESVVVIQTYLNN